MATSRPIDDRSGIPARIAEQIRQFVARGKLAPGVRLGQSELAAQFDASRMPVREALKLLTAEGILIHDPNRGFFVAEQSSDEARQLFKMRHLIEDSLLASIRWPSKNELQALYVKPNPIGNVGRSLLSAVEKIAFETAPFLVCDASLNAGSFYKAHGYIEEGRKDYVARPGGVTSCVVRMRKHRPKPDPA